MKAILMFASLAMPFAIVNAQTTITGITNTASCSSPKTTTTVITVQDAPAQCTVGKGGHAYANSTMSVNGNTFSFTTDTQSTDYSPEISTLSSSTTANATLLVGGSGAGYAVINGFAHGDGAGNGSGTVDCLMLSSSGSVMGGELNSCGEVSSKTINLGSIIRFTYQGTSAEYDDAQLGVGQGDAEGTIRVSFYAADGTTPVPVTWLPGIQPLVFVAVPPCRVIDTRTPTGGPALAAGQTRSYSIPNGACSNIPAAQAYSLNATVVPKSTLSYLTMWPAGQPQPNASTLNSLDGRIKAAASIVPAGSGGSINIYATDSTDFILDINGYFKLPPAYPSLLFHPIAPCRAVDTRQPGDGPLISNTVRSFTIAGVCGVPASGSVDSPLVYSLNITAVPDAPSLGYLTMFPAGATVPLASTLNAPTGAITANAAIVPAGLGGAISAIASGNTYLIIDVNGYYSRARTAPAYGSPPDTPGLFFFSVLPTRVLDTRSSIGMFNGTISIAIGGASSSIPVDAQAFVINATVVPTGALQYLTLWPSGVQMPVVSTLNALDGWISSNMAIVPAGTNGVVNAFASDTTDLIVDVSGYFR